MVYEVGYFSFSFWALILMKGQLQTKNLRVEQFNVLGVARVRVSQEWRELGRSHL